MDKDQLKDMVQYLADTHGFLASVIEKDYHLTRILNSINEGLSDEIVFKGGTLLNKVYLNYHRMSEDLDFSYRMEKELVRSQRSKAISSIRKKMPAFLSSLGLTSDNPEGKWFNNSTQYVFEIQYDSVLISKKEAIIMLEISLRQPTLLPSEKVTIKHFYQDPFSGKDIFPQGTILALSLEECVAEKLKASISRLKPAIRDYYDLSHFIKSGFDFSRKDFLKMVIQKLKSDGYERDFSHNLGLSDQAIQELKRSVKGDLATMIRSDESYDLEQTLVFFNELFAKINPNDL